MQRAALSIIIPAYNESATIGKVINKIVSVQIPHHIDKEIIVVDDCSTDRTKDIVDDQIVNTTNARIRYLRNDVNSGKGFSIRRGIEAATGDFVHPGRRP